MNRSRQGVESSLSVFTAPRTVMSRVALQRPLEELAATGAACWPSIV